MQVPLDKGKDLNTSEGSNSWLSQYKTKLLY